MSENDSNIKDSAVNFVKDTKEEASNMPVPYESQSIKIGSYTKTDKLIAALYMVTDILDKDEPVRSKLRSLGAELLSDIYSVSFIYQTGGTPKNSILIGIENKTGQVLSFLDIASSVELISEMNANILKKEFFELKQSLKEYTQSNVGWLESFISSNTEDSKGEKNILNTNKGQNVVRKTENSKKDTVSDNKNVKDSFSDLKRQRREEILRITRADSLGQTITDIKSKATGALADCGEKTLQRELVSMVQEGVLKKEGEKRWSKYFAI